MRSLLTKDRPALWDRITVPADGRKMHTGMVCDGVCRGDGEHCCGCISAYEDENGDWIFYCNETHRLWAVGYVSESEPS